MAPNRTNAGRTSSKHEHTQKKGNTRAERQMRIEKQQKKDNHTEKKNTEEIQKKVPKDRGDEQHGINRMRHNTESKQNT